MFLKIHSANPSERKIKQVVDCLRKGGIIVYPTDSVYALGCDLHNIKAIQKLCKIKEVKLKEVAFSLVCADLSQISDFTRNFDKGVYRSMRKHLPGPFTFILNANNAVTKLFKFNKKTIGIRVPNNNIPQDIVKLLGHPIVSTSLKHEDKILEYMTDPESIYDDYQRIADIIIDGGIGDNQASTIIDYTNEEPIILREGKGDFLG